MSFKAKLGVIGVVVVAFFTVVLMLLVVGPLSNVASRDVHDAVNRAARAAPQNQRLYAYELLASTRSYALSEAFVKGIQEPPGNARRLAIYDTINEIDKELAARQLKPSFLGVVGQDGRIIARDLDKEADYGDKLSYPAVDAVLKTGRANTTIWLMKEKMMRAAVAPIVVQGKVAGALALAYDFTSADAREDAAQLGSHVAYFMGSAVRASSFTVASDPKTEDASMVAALSTALGGEARKAVASRKTSEVLDVEIQGELYKAIVGPLPTAVGGDPKTAMKQNVGFVVLASIDSAMAPVERTRLLVLVFGVLMLVVVLGSMWFVARHFVEAEDRLELGVNEMINGNMEYTFEVLGEFEGLANALNVLLSRLLGRPEPGEEDESETWRADVIFVEDLATTVAETDVARQLAAEPEEQYFARLFQQYVEALKRAGLPVEGITLEGLTRKLKANEAMLKAKHKCQVVRFNVKTAGGKVSFEPLRIG